LTGCCMMLTAQGGAGAARTLGELNSSEDLLVL
jgi:hypothetical protein